MYINSVILGEMKGPVANEPDIGVARAKSDIAVNVAAGNTSQGPGTGPSDAQTEETTFTTGVTDAAQKLASTSDPTSPASPQSSAQPDDSLSADSDNSTTHTDPAAAQHTVPDQTVSETVASSQACLSVPSSAEEPATSRMAGNTIPCGSNPTVVDSLCDDAANKAEAEANTSTLSSSNDSTDNQSLDCTNAGDSCVWSSIEKAQADVTDENHTNPAVELDGVKNTDTVSRL